MLINIQNVCFPKEYMILSIKKRSLIFCADRIDVIANFAIVTNVVIKKVHCKMTILVLYMKVSPDILLSLQTPRPNMIN